MKLHNEPGVFQQLYWLHFIYAAAEAEAMASHVLPLLQNEFVSFADPVQLEETESSIHMLEEQLVGPVSCSMSKSIVIVI